MNGVPNTTSAEVVALAHTSSGMRQTVMPGARMVKIVTRKLIAVAIELAPTNWTPTSNSVCAGAALDRERRVGGPAGGEGAEERADRHHQAARDEHPDRQGVQARERHVLRADHDRQDVVREAGEGRDDEQEDHQRRVDAEEAVVGLRRRRSSGPAGRELGPHQLGEDAADHEEREDDHQVLRPDDLVVGVDLEVVAPARGAVHRVVLVVHPCGRVIQPPPPVEAADADQEADRADERGGGGVDLGLPRRGVAGRGSAAARPGRTRRGRQPTAPEDRALPPVGERARVHVVDVRAAGLPVRGCVRWPWLLVYLGRCVVSPAPAPSAGAVAALGGGGGRAAGSVRPLASAAAPRRCWAATSFWAWASHAS